MAPWLADVLQRAETEPAPAGPAKPHDPDFETMRTRFGVYAEAAKAELDEAGLDPDDGGADPFTDDSDWFPGQRLAEALARFARSEPERAFVNESSETDGAANA